jgi:hypothetical protein
MRQRMWRSILALGLGAVISATAAAQTPAAQAPAAQAPAPAVHAAPVVVTTSGCNGCGQAAPSCDSCGKGGKAGKHHGGGLFRIGEGCASTAGCSSCKQERTFLFGSCNQFFNAGNDCGKLHGPRAIQPPCVYGTYLHR